MQDEAGGPAARALLQIGATSADSLVRVVDVSGSGRTLGRSSRGAAAAAAAGGAGGGSADSIPISSLDEPISESKSSEGTGNRRIRGSIQHSRTTDELMAMAIGGGGRGGENQSMGSTPTCDSDTESGATLRDSVDAVRQAAARAATRRAGETDESKRNAPIAGGAAMGSRIAGARVLQAPADWASMTQEELRAFAARAAKGVAQGGSAEAVGPRSLVAGVGADAGMSDENREAAELATAMR